MYAYVRALGFNYCFVPQFLCLQNKDKNNILSCFVGDQKVQWHDVYEFVLRLWKEKVLSLTGVQSHPLALEFCAACWHSRQCPEYQITFFLIFDFRHFSSLLYLSLGPIAGKSKRRISCKDLGRGDCEGWLFFEHL